MIRAIILLISESESWTPGKKIICTLWIFFFAISDVKTAFTSQDVTQNNIYIIYVSEPEHLVIFLGFKTPLMLLFEAKGKNRVKFSMKNEEVLPWCQSRQN